MIKNIIANIPFLGKKLYKNTIAKEAKTEKILSKTGKKYDSFQEFIYDAPKYSIDTSAFGRLKRDILRNLGYTLQAYVFIDKSSVDDKIAYFNQDEKILYHDKGTYLKPWDSEKEIIYFSIDDMRPLIDKTKDIDWYNSETCADVVTSITNSKSMASMNGDNDQKLMYVLIAGIILVALISIVGIYTSIENQKHLISVLNGINQSIHRY